ncbi:MAG: undecaprenyldiphospho-muramoylpentapeptide beta-N-acetylglucosaminyltransferase [Candidatus Portnoybacteria bacterium RIFCSPLOWO2_01_FULL_43_11]|uniref:UDP-N-acetylglucosamine--N-acetylmuramyl-(pentapeptide) pyrophosphoryl-undecaprenol N-acetylglucosamine transferase n=4 Tax=Candidatus Portnoyibacteriota TaxID=1817913 RepID=A0A1G2FBH8_9BACT|nr:MAG: undecaprenyldiphospho-muramoylpentapeptide beta-N-acetylglucosaminyltransferase [Candidatus Portnoybacteria bacterium RIFCSPHIGHO2_01_FULL_40_12b]OGZ36405.1 MAG: undecaprenyldiphospho-muramoylpentapeptide beta-N-acetylglucosaminyltransferase [Candidatus Portnoybacteria bacterium RIFCSPHIGHO2_02_FULL_40_23]OGZ38661.1 MAG: undecaprenyldiphospho-muramoylpentapeptide beta-N-acetylglucosaminyltransferase [Candidatus Portnoybacteria bacterium RIFCSPHIGHO2_12_FULL_40_11]OGZ39022.1 MAG: undecapr
MRILFTGGGSGGHLSPITAVARQLKEIASEKNIDLRLFYLGPSDFVNEFLEKEDIKVKTILAGKLRRYFSFKTILDILKIPIGLIQAILFVYAWMPDVIFSKGGYGSVPAVFAGWLFRIPILIHESDAIPGLANRLGGRLVKKIALSFSSSKKYFPLEKTALIGNPIRLDLSYKNKEEGRKVFEISSDKPSAFSSEKVMDKPIILIMGSSQGAEAINEMVLKTLSQLLEKYEIIHICGQKNYEKHKEKIGPTLPKEYHLYPFLREDQLRYGYTLADLIISRAGASSIFEIAAAQKPSILIPLPTAASDHQRENAFEYAKSGGAVILEQTNLTPHLFLTEISRILDNQELAQKMGEGAKSFSTPEAGQKIAEELLNLLKYC